ncbi:hypothetical protein LCGC14_2061570 [marine sediment metagenome]|uniref:Methyltransferase FkbM domain-containing protein n=1 Tax=marine sediment metagenome TaxID=412755 RepID=A0A0F9GZK7_9ZZZZ
MRKIFIDCGGHCGCSIKKFIKGHSGFECFTFEPNPELAKYYEKLPTTLIAKAVWSDDGTTQFYLGGHWGHESSSLYAEKSNVNKDVYAIVEQINLGQWIKDNFNKDDFIVLKFGVEGAEYEVLDSMLKDGSLDYTNELYGEEHFKKHGSTINISRQKRDRIMSAVNTKIKFQNWCAQEDECIARPKVCK